MGSFFARLRRMPFVSALAVSALAVLALSGAAQAQSGFPNAKLEAFVGAAIVVDNLADRWRPRIEGAETAEASDTLQLRAQDEMVAAINRSGGITVGEYLEINRAAESNPELRARLERMYQAKLGN